MRIIKNAPLCSALLIAGIAFGCSAGTGDSSASGAGPASGGSGGGTVTGGANAGASGPGGSTGQIDPSGGGTQVGCDATPDQDKDGDGISIAQGDCNDCDPNVSPGAIEVLTPSGGTGGAGGGSGGSGGAGGGGAIAADEDCDGIIDNVAPASCDEGLALNSSDPLDGARSIELCKQATSDLDWGILSAQWVRANGVATTVNEQIGLLTQFGPNVLPQMGGTVLALSSGKARLPGQPGACTNNSCSVNGFGTPPAGFPAVVPNCDGLDEINDDIALEVNMRAPTNATGYKFDFKFTSFEFDEYVCTSYNDQFIALVNPAPMGSQNGNISFDSMGNPVSVNIAFFDVCASCVDFALYCFSANCPSPPANCCSSGPAELMGTGFDTGFGAGEDAGGTSWLQTQAPVDGGSTLAIRFAIWDTGDTAYDSTAIIDNFQWIANGGTVELGTNPIPE